MLANKKTYIVAAMMAAVAIVEGALGIDIPGVEVQGDWLEMVLGSGLAASFRSALAGMKL